MMGVYLYCAVPAGELRCDGVTGIDGSSVTALIEARVEYWYSPLAARPDPSIEGIRQHNAVVEAAVSTHTTPLPIRFGQWFEHEDQLREQVRRHCTTHIERLENFRGALEFGLRVVDPRLPTEPSPDAIATGSGRDYLVAVRNRLSPQPGPMADAVATQMREQFSGIVRAEMIEPLRTAHGVLSAAHMVAREQFTAWHQAVDILRQQFPELRFLASGPWPPYSFAA